MAYEYDALDRLLRIDYGDGFDIEFAYTPDNLVDTASNEAGTVEFSYDAVNRIVNFNDVFGLDAAFSYDGNGNLKSLTYPGGKTVAYSYDEDNRLTVVTDWLDRTIQYVYGENGKLERIDYPNQVVTEYEYDQAAQPSRIKHTGPDGVFASYALTRSGGRIVSVDAVAPLPAASIPEAKSFTYDAANRVVARNDVPYSYDDDGRLLGNGVCAFSYNPAGQLETAVSSQLVVVLHLRRARKPGRRLFGRRLHPVPGASLAGEGAIAGADGFFQLGLGALHPMQTAWRPESRRTVPARLLPFRLYRQYRRSHRRRRGRFRRLRLLALRRPGRHDRLDGQPVFVQRLPWEQSPIPPGLVYMRARYFEPDSSRFITEDPAGFSSGEYNLYRFARNDPVNFVDPAGLAASPAGEPEKSLLEEWLEIFEGSVSVGEQVGGEFNVGAAELTGALNAGSYKYECKGIKCGLSAEQKFELSGNVLNLFEVGGGAEREVDGLQEGTYADHISKKEFQGFVGIDKLKFKDSGGQSMNLEDIKFGGSFAVIVGAEVNFNLTQFGDAAHKTWVTAHGENWRPYEDWTDEQFEIVRDAQTYKPGQVNLLK